MQRKLAFGLAVLSVCSFASTALAESYAVWNGQCTRVTVTGLCTWDSVLLEGGGSFYSATCESSGNYYVHEYQPNELQEGDVVTVYPHPSPDSDVVTVPHCVPVAVPALGTAGEIMLALLLLGTASLLARRRAQDDGSVHAPR